MGLWREDTKSQFRSALDFFTERRSWLNLEELWLELNMEDRKVAVEQKELLLC